jgi:hypothetical protein
MLPASLQTTAAIVLVAGGLLSCFAGYRVFRVVLGIYGFILGALLASSFMGNEQTLWMVVGAIVGGLAGAAILILAYFVGVALIGAGVGALTANVIWASLGREPGMLAVILFAIVGALGALALQRYVIIISTAFGGAWTAMVGGFTLAGDQVASQAAARNDVWLAYPLNPAPGQRWVLIGWFVLGLIGALVQLGITSKQRTSK